MIVLCPVLALVGATAATIALDLRRPSTFVLAAYVVLVGQTVLVLEALSLFTAVTATNFALAEAVLAATFLALARASPRRTPPVAPLFSLARRGAGEHPLLAVLGLAVLLGVGYELALAVLTPPNNWDSMTYHLSRAAAWRQQHRIGYVAAHTSRENVNPPNAEILVLASMLAAHGDRLAAAWQWLAELACLAGVYVVALRAGAPRASAVFAALLFATLSQVALQATTTQNDLCTASLVLAAVALLASGDRHREPLAASAVGLALGTKLTAVFALPGVALVAVFLVPRRRRRRVILLGVAMTLLLGSYAFVQNVIQSGSVLGKSPENHAQIVRTVGDPPKTIALTAASFVLDPSGVTFGRSDEDRSYFGPLGAILILPLVVAALRRSGRRDRLRAALAGAFLLYLLALAGVYRFNPWAGRFLITPAALAAPLAATVYEGRGRRTVVAAVAVATLAATLVLDHAKPAGVAARQSIWSVGRADAQAMQRPAMRPVLQALDDVVPRTASVVAAIGADDWDYPLYGPRLTRRVSEITGSRIRAELPASHAGWLLVRTGYVAAIPPSWDVVTFRGSGLALACKPSPECRAAVVRVRGRGRRRP